MRARCVVINVPIPSTVEMLVGALHPILVEQLLDLMDSDPDARSKLAKMYKLEWPERAEKFFISPFRPDVS